MRLGIYSRLPFDADSLSVSVFDAQTGQLVDQSTNGLSPIERVARAGSSLVVLTDVVRTSQPSSFSQSALT